MESVTKFFKEEDDFLFEKGEVKGREKERIEMISNMIVKLGFSDEQIANILGLPMDLIQKHSKTITSCSQTKKGECPQALPLNYYVKSYRLSIYFFCF